MESILNLDLKDLIQIAAGSVIATGLVYLTKIAHSYTFFQSRGISTPKYKFISGNYEEIMKKNHSDALKEWTEKYGKLYGYYEGHLPILVTTDLDIIQNVFIDNFSNFTGRKMLPFYSDDRYVGLFMASNDRWRRFRSIINPTFSPAKMKQLVPFFKLCCTRFMDIIDKNLGKELLMNDVFSNLALDVTWNCAYGYDIDCQNNINNPFLMRLKSIFDNDKAYHPFILMLIYFHELKPFIIPFMNFLSHVIGKLSSNLMSPRVWINQNVIAIIENRKKLNIKRNDYMQILLDHQSDDFNKEDNLTQSSIIHKKLNMNEIIANLSMFLFAGMDSISSGLNFALYEMITRQDELEKLRKEVDSIFDPTLEDDESIYENMKKLEYLDMFLNEVFRIHPVSAKMLSRRCTKATTLNGIDIPVGTIIAPDVYSLNFDPKHWGRVHPSEFYPLRFSPDYDRNKNAYLSFGYGPMHCLGAKFAFLEMKLTLAKIIKYYDVTLAKDFEFVIVEGILRKIKGGLRCHFERRTTP